jgi:hypothetical protein
MTVIPRTRPTPCCAPSSGCDQRLRSDQRRGTRRKARSGIRAAELARRIPGARKQTIAAGHLIHDAEPEAFARTALMFLRPGQALAASSLTSS